MKNILFVAVVKIITLACLFGQSQTFEMTPDFYKSNTDFITNEIQYNLSAKALEFIGLSCYHFGNEDAAIFYRLKTDDQWSNWMKFDRQHEFVDPNRFAYQTQAIAKPFSDIQFKTTEPLNSPLTIRFFLAAADKGTYHQIEKSLNCDKPDVCDRDCWCPTCPIDNTPEFTEPTHLIVHHSAGNNESNNFATVVEYIWDLHTKTNGWDDIGYNWLIDPNGILYEGRGDNLQGAHFSCINENTVGICVIGDYTSVEPSEAAVNTLVNLLAFEATEHDIDIEAQSYHEIGEFNLNNVAGHRDSSGSTNACSSTACPGNSFYPLLTDIRIQVAELACYNNELSHADDIKNHSIKVYPNPISHNLFIESPVQELQSLEIVDINGISHGFLNAGTANDLSHLNAGVYLLVNNGMLVQKLIKK